MIASGAQIRAARAILNWKRSDLAAAARLHKNSIAHWEAKGRITPRHYQGPRAGPRRIEDALLKAGVELFNTPTPGVRLCLRTNFQTP